MQSITNPQPSWTCKDDLRLHKQTYLSCIERVLDSGQLLLGKELENFELEFSSYIGTKYGVGCDNATNAIFLALKSLDIGHGDYVLTVANTAIPTVSAICQAGAVPVFADVTQDGLIDLSTVPPEKIEALKAVVAVHLYGHPCDMDEMVQFANNHSLYLIEDCSQAHGAEYNNKKVGSFGDISIFSFYPTKPLGGFGDAGILLTNDATLYKRLRRLRFYGAEGEYLALEAGFNSRMDEIHAAVLRDKLTRLDKNILHRSQVSSIYRSYLANSPLTPIQPLANTTTSNYLVPFLCQSDRNELLSKLALHNIACNISYKYPIHLMPAYSHLGYDLGSLPMTERICKSIISFPIYDYINLDKVRSIASIIRESF